MDAATRSRHRRRCCETADLEREIRSRLRDAVSAEQERRYLAILEALDTPATRSAVPAAVDHVDHYEAA